MKLDPNTPILIGGGQITEKVKPADGMNPHQIMIASAKKAMEATGNAAAVQKAMDCVAAIQLTVDSPGAGSVLSGTYKNLPRTIARGLGHTEMPLELQSGTGGNSPQMMVNNIAERIANGETRVVVVAGCEVLSTMVGRLKSGLSLDDWGDNPGGTPLKVGLDEEGSSACEARHRLNYPVNIYPLFENALRVHYGRTIEEHMAAMGRLNAPFTKVAAQNPYAWFPVERTAEELVTVTDSNRWVGFPYPKFLNAVMRVNMGAGLVMCSVSAAEEMGIDPSKWIFLHGCADAHDKWFISDRENFHSSPAIRTIAKTAFDMAGWTPDDLDLIDLYSCFPSAVQIGSDEIGIAQDDPRGLTITGGLPYFGGAGNSYVMNSIAEMVTRLQASKPGTKGLCTANGYYVTKHSMGLYSNAPKEGKWQRKNPSEDQAVIEARPSPKVVEQANGSATIETYTVVHGRNGPDFGVVVGRLGDGARFVSNTPTDPAVFASLMDGEQIGRTGTVAVAEDGRNIFTPDGL